MTRRLLLAALALLLAVPARAALDTKNKRGSVIGLSSPGRQWLAEPDGTDIAASTDRMSVMTYAAAVAPEVSGGGGAGVKMHHYRMRRAQAPSPCCEEE